MSNCIHEIGNYQTERYDCVETEFIYSNFTDLDEAAKLKSSVGSLNNFCPKCGFKLEGVLDARIAEIRQAIEERKKEEAKARAAAEKKFQQEVKEVSKHTKLNLLPEEGYFLVLCEPVSQHDKRNVVLNGKKEDILRSSVNILKQTYAKKEALVIKTIFKVPTKEEFNNQIQEHGYVVEKGIATKEIDGKLFSLDFSNYGTVYLTRTNKDGDKDYDNFGVHRLAEFLKADFKLETLQLG